MQHTAHSTALPQHAAGAVSALQRKHTKSTAIRSKPPTQVQPSSRCSMNSQLSPFTSNNDGSVEGHPDPARVTQPTASGIIIRSNWRYMLDHNISPNTSSTLSTTNTTTRCTAQPGTRAVIPTPTTQLLLIKRQNRRVISAHTNDGDPPGQLCGPRPRKIRNPRQAFRELTTLYYWPTKNMWVVYTLDKLTCIFN